jgi:hypothetical protein
VAALEAHDDVGLFRQPVDDLALPLVAPLGADDDNIGHCDELPCFLLFQTMIKAETRPPSGSCLVVPSRNHGLEAGRTQGA